jgi:hypothetical protein
LVCNIFYLSVFQMERKTDPNDAALKYMNQLPLDTGVSVFSQQIQFKSVSPQENEKAKKKSEKNRKKKEKRLKKQNKNIEQSKLNEPSLDDNSDCKINEDVAIVKVENKSDYISHLTIDCKIDSYVKDDTLDLKNVMGVDEDKFAKLIELLEWHKSELNEIQKYTLEPTLTKISSYVKKNKINKLRHQIADLESRDDPPTNELFEKYTEYGREGRLESPLPKKSAIYLNSPENWGTESDTPKRSHVLDDSEVYLRPEYDDEDEDEDEDEPPPIDTLNSRPTRGKLPYTDYSYGSSSYGSSSYSHSGVTHAERSTYRREYASMMIPDGYDPDNPELMFPAPNLGGGNFNTIAWKYPKYLPKYKKKNDKKQKHQVQLVNDITDITDTNIINITNIDTNTNIDIKLESKEPPKPEDKFKSMGIIIEKQMDDIVQNVNKDDSDESDEEIDEINAHGDDVGDEDELICHITFEPITKIGMTCYGNIYEYDEICKWVSKNDTDPISRRLLFTKKIVTIPLTTDRKKLKRWQKKIRENQTILANYPHELLYPEAKIKEVFDTINRISAFQGEQLNQWKLYSQHKLSTFRDPNYSKCGFPIVNYIDQYDQIARPPNTGCAFEYIQMGGDMFDKYQHNNINFKGMTFNGADISNNYFVQCIFSRCTFIGTNLSGCIFMGCYFQGEEVNFAGAKVTEDTQFIDCIMEDIGSWNTCSDLQQVKKILEHRHLAEGYQVNSFGGFY